MNDWLDEIYMKLLEDEHEDDWPELARQAARLHAHMNHVVSPEVYAKLCAVLEESRNPAADFDSLANRLDHMEGKFASGFAVERALCAALKPGGVNEQRQRMAALLYDTVALCAGASGSPIEETLGWLDDGVDHWPARPVTSQDTAKRRALFALGDAAEESDEAFRWLDWTDETPQRVSLVNYDRQECTGVGVDVTLSVYSHDVVDPVVRFTCRALDPEDSFCQLVARLGVRLLTNRKFREDKIHEISCLLSEAVAVGQWVGSALAGDRRPAPVPLTGGAADELNMHYVWTCAAKAAYNRRIGRPETTV